MRMVIGLVCCLFSFNTKKDVAVQNLYDPEFCELRYVTENTQAILSRMLAQDGRNFEIIHIGDSHLQIGDIPTSFLNEFKQEGINLQEGWFLPEGVFTDLYNKNLKISYKSKYIDRQTVYGAYPSSECGITGRAFQFSTGKSILKIKAESEEQIFRVEFLHESRVKPHISCKGSVQSTVNLSDNYAVTTIDFKEKQEKIKLRFLDKNEDKPWYFAMRINHVEGVSYSAFGVSGSKYEDFEAAPHLYEQLKALKPDLLLVALGTNDSYVNILDSNSFRMELQQFISRIKLDLPETAVVLLSAPDTNYKNMPPKHLKMINREIEAVCVKQELAFWDWYRMMGGDGSIKTWVEQDLTIGDQLHFNRKGYELIGQLLAKSILVAAGK